MDIANLKNEVVRGNKELPRQNLVKYSWGNVSGIDRKNKVIVIKPVGMPYDELSTDNISVTDLQGNILEGPIAPSVDLPIHQVLYENFENIGAIVHTHSTYATMWAQSERDIPCFGTTHADYFYGSIPCTRQLTKEEINGDYEKETGKVIVERFQGLDPNAVPGVIVAGHGVFTWGSDVWDAVHKSVVLEEIAKMAFGTVILSPTPKTVPQELLDKHYYRKHGANAYFSHDDFGNGMIDHES